MKQAHSGLPDKNFQALEKLERETLQTEVLHALSIRSYTRAELQELLARRGIRAEGYLLFIVLTRLEAEGRATNDAGEWSATHD